MSVFQAQVRSFMLLLYSVLNSQCKREGHHKKLNNKLHWEHLYKYAHTLNVNRRLYQNWANITNLISLNEGKPRNSIQWTQPILMKFGIDFIKLRFNESFIILNMYTVHYALFGRKLQLKFNLKINHFIKCPPIYLIECSSYLRRTPIINNITTNWSKQK